MYNFAQDTNSSEGNNNYGFYCLPEYLLILSNSKQLRVFQQFLKVFTFFTSNGDVCFVVLFFVYIMTRSCYRSLKKKTLDTENQIFYFSLSLCV